MGDGEKVVFRDLQELRDELAKNASAERIAFLQSLHDRSKVFADGYGTHLPLLAAVIAAASDGDILELGAGRASTPLLSAMCALTGRGFITVEPRYDWALDDTQLFMKRRQNGDDDALVHFGGVRLQDPLEYLKASTRHWAVAFVDFGEGAEWLEQRTQAVELLRNNAHVIVVHDTFNVPSRLDVVLESFPFRVDYTSLCPATTVVGMRPFWRDAEPVRVSPAMSFKDE